MTEKNGSSLILDKLIGFLWNIHIFLVHLLAVKWILNTKNFFKNSCMLYVIKSVLLREALATNVFLPVLGSRLTSLLFLKTVSGVCGREITGVSHMPWGNTQAKENWQLCRCEMTLWRIWPWETSVAGLPKWHHPIFIPHYPPILPCCVVLPEMPEKWSRAWWFLGQQ